MHRQKPINVLKFIVYLGFENQPFFKYITEKSSERKKPREAITVIDKDMNLSSQAQFSVS